MSMQEAILSLDLGTTACKALLFTPEGVALAEGQREYPTYYPAPGLAEQEAADWWSATVAAARAALGAATEPVHVIALGLSTQRETMLPVDAAGRPLRRAITWLDRRSGAQATRLAEQFGAAEIHARTGMLPEATFSGTKLRWLAEHEPELAREAALFLQPKDYLFMRLTGLPATDPSVASRTLLWSIHGGWLDELIEWASIRKGQLPPVAGSGEAGRLTAEAAVALGLPAGIPVALGAGDRCCEALGAGVRPGGRVMLSTGTATNVAGALAHLPQPLLPGVLYTRHAVAGEWLAEQGMGTGGSVLRWLRDTLGEVDYRRLGAEAAASPPGAKGLLLLPFFMGVRATRWNPTARGAILGLSLAHGRGELARSVMEGVACEVRACLDLLRRAGQRPTEFVLLGGGAKSALWSQIKADVTGLPTVVPRVPEAASLGAMLLAGQAAGLWSDPAERALALNPGATQFAPNAALEPLYDKLYALYNQLYSSVAPLYAELAELAEGSEAAAE